MGALQTYMDDASNHAASSSWGAPGCFIGRDLLFRTIRSAHTGETCRELLRDQSGSPTGSYPASRVDGGRRRRGIVVTMIPLDRPKRYRLRGVERRVVMLDWSCIIVLSSRANRKYHATGRLTDKQLCQLDEAQRYGRAQLVTLASDNVTPPLGDRILSAPTRRAKCVNIWPPSCPVCRCASSCSWSRSLRSVSTLSTSDD
ncbi:hypothetical protein [Burkholderia sp. ABCPW 14]|uniref:hypothetical protein n=1 Tax=Burkholderia sp. ABCPW 14 TaxID=1637860 RepID=UPI000A632582|nr:hypothetical protein [Burkholderia sp. ABCPW 14]